MSNSTSRNRKRKKAPSVLIHEAPSTSQTHVPQRTATYRRAADGRALLTHQTEVSLRNVDPPTLPPAAAASHPTSTIGSSIDHTTQLLDMDMDIGHDPPQTTLEGAEKSETCAVCHISSCCLFSSAHRLPIVKDRPLVEWIDCRDEYLDELLCLDAPPKGIDGAICMQCGEQADVFRCKDCVGGRTLCRTCIVSAHTYNPLHCVEVCSFSFPILFICSDQ